MEIKFMGTRIEKLMWILIKIGIMGLIMTGIILISRSYIKNASQSQNPDNQCDRESHSFRDL